MPAIGIAKHVASRVLWFIISSLSLAAAQSPRGGAEIDLKQPGACQVRAVPCTTISIRRFCARPCGVFQGDRCVSPNPRAERMLGLMAGCIGIAPPTSLRSVRDDSTPLAQFRVGQLGVPKSLYVSAADYVGDRRSVPLVSDAESPPGR